jgi:hypothetical protein
MAKRVPLPVLRTLMGHADIKTTLLYIDVGEKDRRTSAMRSRGSSGPAWQPDSASAGGSL